MDRKLIKEFKLKLKAPMVALEKIVQGRYLPKVFAGAALAELRKLEGLLDKCEDKKRS